MNDHPDEATPASEPSRVRRGWQPATDDEPTPPVCDIPGESFWLTIAAHAEGES